MKPVLTVVSVFLIVLVLSPKYLPGLAAQSLEEPRQIGFHPYGDVQAPVALVVAVAPVVARMQRKKPTKEGALEYLPEFRKAGAEAWQKVGYGNRPRPERGSPEAGFTIDKDGKINGVRVTAQEHGAGEMKFVIGPDTLAVFHTHSDPWIRRPSTGDEASARRNHMQVYTATKDGLFLTGPDGRTVQVFQRDDWATRKNPE